MVSYLINKNEIAIDDMALKKLGYEEKLNQTIEIEYEDYASGRNSNKRFYSNRNNSIK